MSIVQHANSILNIFETASSFKVRGEVLTDGLSIKMFGEDSNLTTWLKNNFGFVVDMEMNASINDKHEVSTICSDARLQETIEIFDSQQFKTQVFSRRGIIFYRMQAGLGKFIDYFPSLGCAWLTRQPTEENKPTYVVFLYSSRTPMHYKELRIGLVDIINRYFESRGWHTFHAGAITSSTRNKTFMVTGSSNSGKTSLILQLLASKFQFIGNERLFCKPKEQEFLIKPFPQTINVGIGSALQYEHLRDCVERPDRCSCYQSQFEPERVFNSPPEQPSGLPDKLKLLPSELVKLLNALPPLSNGQIDAILVPAIGDEPQTIVEVLTEDETMAILRENYFASVNDQVYPRWLPLAYEYHAALDPTAIIDELCKKPAWRIRYDKSNTDLVLPEINELLNQI